MDRRDRQGKESYRGVMDLRDRQGKESNVGHQSRILQPGYLKTWEIWEHDQYFATLRLAGLGWAWLAGAGLGWLGLAGWAGLGCLAG